MEAENTSSSSSWNSATNWSIYDGSLLNSITLESSVSPIDDDSVVSTRKSPLLLRPSSPDSGPCEIKISFAQKHEVRQVYVRSTARVYEIYYSPNSQSTNEYLCTVRCSLAEEELLHAIDLEAAHSNGSHKELAEEKSKSGSTSSTCEDDWVEVKVPDSPLLDSTLSSRSSKSDSHPGRSKQDLYEATAEITDPDPCTSLILRLLSLQDKEHIYVDEVYVFADPVDSAESEDQQGRAENSAGSSLMAMLVPTLLQLSKTSNSRAADKNALEIRNEQNSQVIVPKGIELISTSNKYQLEAKSSIADQDLDGATDEPMQSHTLTQNPDIKPDSTDKEKNFTCCQSERAMDQLVSRVSKIEEILLRFEENMLKPICSIDERLQRVEQQLEVFTKNYQYSEFSSGTRFSAPDFSCTESGSNSFFNDGSDFPSCGVSGSDKRDIPYDKLTIPPNDMSASVKVTRLLPSLVVNAPPEFSNGEHDYASEPTIDSASYKPREAVSIDDALASALAGFISSTSIHRQGYTQTLAIKAPEFTNDEDDNDNIVASPRVQREMATDKAPKFTNGEDDNDNIVASPRVQREMTTDKAPKFTNGEDDNDNIVASPRVQREMTTDKAPEFTNDEDDNDNIVASPRVQREMTTDKAPEFTNDEDDDDNIVASPRVQRKMTTDKAPEFDEDDNDNIVASPRVQREMTTDKAPEFTNDEDDNDNVVASPRVQHEMTTDKAPEFTNDEDDNDIVASPRVQPEMTTDPSIPDKINGIECVGGALLSPCSVASFESGREKMSSLNNDYFEEVTQGVDEGGHINEGGEGNVHCHLTPVKHEVLENTSNTEISNGVYEILSSDYIVVPNQQPENQIDNISVTNTTDEVGVESPEIPTVSDRTVDTSVIRKPSTEHILQNVLESHAYPVLDFEAPILDVKFECQENCISKSPLEVLWNDTAESSIEYPPHVEATDNGTGIDELILLENGEASGATGNDLFVDMFHYELETMPSIMDGEEIQNRYSGSSQEISATSLI